MTTILQVDGPGMTGEQIKVVLEQVKLAVDFGRMQGEFSLNGRLVRYDLSEVMTADAACEEP